MGLLKAIRHNFHPLWRLRQIGALQPLITSIRIPVPIKIKGIDKRIYVDFLRNAQIWIEPETYEPEELGLLREFVRKYKLKRFFDVGANVGLFAFTFLAAATGAQVVAFEPDDANLSLLRRSAVQYERSIMIAPVAVSDKVGETDFAIDQFGGTTGSIAANYAVGPEQYVRETPKITVKTTTIDQASRDYFPPDIIKIDVEGAELAVLKGAVETLRERRPLLIIEMSVGSDWQTTISFLQSFGYLLSDAETGHRIETAADIRPPYSNVVALHQTLEEPRTS